VNEAVNKIIIEEAIVVDSPEVIILILPATLAEKRAIFPVNVPTRILNRTVEGSNNLEGPALLKDLGALGVPPALLKVHVVPWIIRGAETLTLAKVNDSLGSLKVQICKEILVEKVLKKLKWKKLWVLVVSISLEKNISRNNRQLWDLQKLDLALNMINSSQKNRNLIHQIEQNPRKLNPENPHLRKHLIPNLSPKNDQYLILQLESNLGNLVLEDNLQEHKAHLDHKGK